jgi:hypothetical protein
LPVFSSAWAINKRIERGVLRNHVECRELGGAGWQHPQILVEPRAGFLFRWFSGHHYPFGSPKHELMMIVPNYDA